MEITSTEFKKPLACCHGNRKVHPIAMATGKHRGLLLGLGIWEVAGGGGWRRLSLGRSTFCVGGVCYPAWDPLPHTLPGGQAGCLLLAVGSEQKILPGIIP